MPLTAEERDWAQKKIAGGANKEDVFAFIESHRQIKSNVQRPAPAGDATKEPYYGPMTRNVMTTEQELLSHEDLYPGATHVSKDKMPPLKEFGPGGKTYEPGTGNWPGGYEQANLLKRTPKSLAKEIAYTGGKAIASTAGGLIAPRALQTLFPAVSKGARIGASIVGQGIGQYGGEIGRQALEGEPISHTRAGIEGGLVSGTGAAMYGAGRLLAAGGGVTREAVQEATLRPALTRPVQNEEILGATGAIQASLGRTKETTTVGRRALEGMIRQFDSSGQTIDPTIMTDALTEQLSGFAKPPSQAADRIIRGFISRMKGRIAQASTTDMYGLGQKMSAENFDRLLREELTSSVYEYEQKFGGPIAQNAIEEARNSIAQAFYQKLGPGAASAGAMANRSLTARERLEGVIKPVDISKIDFSSPQKVKMAISPGSMNGQQIREAVSQYDADTGENLSQILNDLLTRQEWTPAQSQQASELVQLALINYRPRSLVETGMQRLAPAALRSARYPGMRSSVTSEAAGGFPISRNLASRYLKPAHEKRKQ